MGQRGKGKAETRKKERKILPVTMLFCEKNSTSHMITVF
jgi:hypothetical protein